LLTVCQSLDRGNLVVLVCNGERETGERTFTVDMHRARAALAVVASLLAPGQAEVLVQRVE
jgi:hypothetical protein